MSDVVTLFDPVRHAPLRGAVWSDQAARAGIAAIVDDVARQFDAERLWPLHPLEREPGQAETPQPMLYNGAAGVVWALRALAEDGLATTSLDLAAIAATLDAHADRCIAANVSELPSHFLGLGGVLMLQWSFTRDAGCTERLHGLVEANLDNPTREALWGSPGTLVAAAHLLDASGDERWQRTLRRGVDLLFRQMHPVRHSAHPDREVMIWTQDLYGQQVQYLGAGHGFAGNVYAVLRAAKWLEADVVAAFEARAAATLEVAAARQPGLVHWDPHFDPTAAGRPPRPLLQDCHGAPGIVCRLATAANEPLRRLLVDAGELVWQAGPLVKRPGLCHGTDGNGYAFLKLHAMTGEASWLARARAFAMHALQQSDALAEVHGRRVPSLWTGDLGLACYLSSCLRADPALPTLDRF